MDFDIQETPSTSNAALIERQTEVEEAEKAKIDMMNRKQKMLQKEERALLSLLSQFRSHQRTLELEKIRLQQVYLERIKKEQNYDGNREK